MNGAANQQNQQHYSSSTTARTNGEYSSSSSMTSGTLPRDLNKSQNSSNHIYQSPTKLSIDSSHNQNGKLNVNNNTTNIVCSLPNTPLSSHNNINNQNGTAAYAVSPVSHMNQMLINNNKAPLVSTNNNESFDDDEHNEEDDDDEEEEDGCYESPTAALRNKIENYHLNQKNQTSIKANGLESEILNGGVGSLNTNNNNNGYYATHSQGAGSGNGSSSCNGSEQYDHVDHSAYDATNGIFVDDSNEPIIGTALVMYSFAGSFKSLVYLIDGLNNFTYVHFYKYENMDRLKF